MKLSEFKGEKAFEVVAGLMDPIAAIVKSEAFKAAKVKTRMELAKLILTADMNAAKEILAILADVPREEYTCTGATVMRDILEAVSDKDFVALFISPRQKTEEEPYASVSGNAAAKA